MGLTGDNLTLAIQTATTERPALAEDCLYEGDVLMQTGEPGVGKSILTTQLACSLTLSQSVYDFFKVPTPRYVYYLQLEGEPEQAYERMQRMASKVNRNTNLLYWDARPQGIDLLDPIQTQTILKEIAGWGKKPDLIVLDPLYQSVFGELARELPSKAIIRFLGAARSLFKPCAFILVHHTKRTSYTRDGKPITEVDPYFGSTWLKAYINTSFLLKSGTGQYAGDQVMLVCKKSRGADVIKDLILHYDPETDTVSADAPVDEQSGYERVSKFLAECKQRGKYSNFFEVRDACKLSTRQLRYVQIALLRSGKLRCDKWDGHKKLWQPV